MTKTLFFACLFSSLAVSIQLVKRAHLPLNAAGIWPLAEFNILDYGAQADNFTMNTIAIQKAITVAAATQGGGFVVIPGILDVPGTAFRTGGLRLLSNVYLYLQKGATLQASNSINDYPEDWDFWDIIHAENVSNCGIIGESSSQEEQQGGREQGERQGQGEGAKGVSTISGPMWQMVAGFDPTQNSFIPVTWQGQKNCSSFECRPRGLIFVDVENITIHNFRLQDSADWSSLYRRCKHVSITNISISGALNWPNNDGMDLESGYNITVSHVDISTGDDGIVFASGNTNNMNHPWPQSPPYSPLQFVRVSNCHIRSHSSGIKVEAIFQKEHGDIFDIEIDNITIQTSNRGLGFQVRTGRGRVHSMSFSNIIIDTEFITGTNWWGAAEPIWMTAVPEDAYTAQAGLGNISNISFTNIIARSENGVLLSARDQPSGGISNINFTNVFLFIQKFGNVSRPMHDFRPVDPSVPTQPTYNSSVDGFYFERANSIRLVNCGVSFLKPMEPFYGKCYVVTPDSNVSFDSFNCSL